MRGIVIVPGVQAFLLSVLLLLGGCMSTMSNRAMAGGTRTFVGVVTVDMPATYGKVKVLDVSTLGLGADGSLFLGWKRSQHVYADPQDCQIIVIIKSAVEAEHGLKIAELAKGGDLCLVDYARTLPRL
jgi:hypothetical protein